MGVTCSTDGYLKMWKVELTNKTNPVKLVRRKRFATGAVHSIALNPDNEMSIALGGEKGGVQVWNIVKDKEIMEAFSLKAIANECPEQTVDLGHGEGEEEFSNFLDNAENETLGIAAEPAKKKAKRSQDTS